MVTPLKWRTFLLVLVTSGLLMTSSAETVSVVTASGVLQALQAYFRSDCVSIVSLALHGHTVAKHVAKSLSRSRVSTALVDAGTLLEATGHCLRPINLLLYDGGEVGRHLTQISKRMRLSKHVWLLILKESQSMDEVFLGVYIPFDCEFIVGHISGSDVVLSEVYRVSSTWPLRSERFGSWSADKGLTAPQGGLYTRRVSLHGLTLRATNVHGPPLSMISVVNGRTELTGFFGDIWTILEKAANFTTIHMVPTEGETNQYDEMFKQVLSGEADVTSTCIGHSTARDLVADFTIPLKIIPFRIFISEPTGREMKWNDFLTPFSRALWLSLIVSTLVAASLLTLHNYLTQRVGDISENLYPLTDAIFLVFGSVFCQQGHAQTPQTIPCRIVHIVMLLVGVIVFNSYSSNLIAILTVFTPSMPFETMEQLYNKPGFAFAVINNSLSHLSLKNAKSGILQLLNKRDVVNNPQNTPLTYLEGFKRACTSRYAFVALSEFLTVERDNLNCTLVCIPQRFTTYSASMALTKGSPYRGLLNHNLLKLYAGGFITKLYKKALDERVSSPTEDLASISMENVVPILSVFVTGAVVALLVLVLERLLHTLTGSAHQLPENLLRLRCPPSCSDDDNEYHYNVEWLD